MKIIVDQRERNGIIEYLKKSTEIEVAALKIGDFILSDDVCVERKTIRDFVSSLVDGRLFNQAVELKNNFSKPLFIIEGDFTKILEISNVNSNAIRSSIVSLLLDYQIPILFAENEIETAELLKTIARREQEDNKKNISIRGSKKLFTQQEMQQYLIEGLPGVGPTLAKSLLIKFKTPKKIINANTKQLTKVEKIGKKKAEAIQNVVNSKYE